MGRGAGRPVAETSPSTGAPYSYLGRLIAALPVRGTLFLRLGLSTGALLGPIVVTAVLFAFPLTLLATTVPLAFGSALQEEKPGPGKTLGSLFAISTAGSVLGALVTAYIAVPFIGTNRAFLLSRGFAFCDRGAVCFSGYRDQSRDSDNFRIGCKQAHPSDRSRAFPSTKPGSIIFIVPLLVTRRLTCWKMIVMAPGYFCWMGRVTTGWQAATGRKSQFDYIPALLRHVARFRPPPGRALVLGLGAGTLVRDLRRRGYDIEAVEIDPLVHEVARTYFSFPSEVATLHFDDARAFLERAVEAGKTFDVIIMDVTGGGHHPEHIYNRDAYLLIKRLLGRDGVMGANMVVFTHAPLDRAARYSAATLASVFPVVEAVDLHPDAGETDSLSQLLLFGAFRKPLVPFDGDRGQRLLPIEKDLRPLTDDWKSSSVVVDPCECAVAPQHAGVVGEASLPAVVAQAHRNGTSSTSDCQDGVFRRRIARSLRMVSTIAAAIRLDAKTRGQIPHEAGLA